MNKGIFWKVIVSLLVVGLFIFLWMSQWHYSTFINTPMKTSKLTGKIYIIEGPKWKPLY